MVLGLVTHPLLTAFPGQLDPPREGAVRAGQANVHAAQGHAAHRPVQARALVLAAALEGLTAAVHRATEDAGSTIFGGAHADLAVGRGAEVAEEALVRVAGVALGAQLAQLLGADAAAAATVQHEAHARRAARRLLGRASARPAAVLADGRLRGGPGGQRRSVGSHALPGRPRVPPWQPPAAAGAPGAYPYKKARKDKLLE